MAEKFSSNFVMNVCNNNKKSWGSEIQSPKNYILKTKY